MSWPLRDVSQLAQLAVGPGDVPVGSEALSRINFKILALVVRRRAVKRRIVDNQAPRREDSLGGAHR